MLFLDYGKQMNQLRTDLEQYAPEILNTVDLSKVETLQRTVDNASYRVNTLERDLRATVQRRGTLEEERAGYKRTLELLAIANVGGRSKQHIEEKVRARQRAIDQLSIEVSVLEAHLRILVADLRGHHANVIEALEDGVAAALFHKELCDNDRRRRRLFTEGFLTRNRDLLLMWSPTPVIGYRFWRIGLHDLTGMRHKWPTSAMKAACSEGSGVPHTDGRCSTIAFGCGVYAAKDPKTLLRRHGHDTTTRFAIGAVALEGKVVEHEKGYRAERARVVLLITSDRGVMRVFDRQRALDRVFADPDVRDLQPPAYTAGDGERWSYIEQISSWLKEAEKESYPWT